MCFVWRDRVTWWILEWETPWDRGDMLILCLSAPSKTRFLGCDWDCDKKPPKEQILKSFLSSDSSCARQPASDAKYRLLALLLFIYIFFWEDPVMSGFINPPTELVRKLWNKVSCWKPCLESAYPHLHFDFCDLTEGTGCPCQISLAYRGIYKVELPKAAWLMRTATATQPMHP